MPERDVSSTATAGQVEIEAVAWVTKFVGGDGSTRRVYHESLKAGDTCVRCCAASAVASQAAQSPLGRPDRRPRRHIEVLVNDAVLDITHTSTARYTTAIRSP
jgi:hypothetical protein